ncbi:hypothetical protein UFOVP584_6 [uncultured Caudovirales phage]|uniref:Phage tail tape measure protein n=1 Tax=uncultured Caudovirales phage TaxID=2100421 RepID=A0A6J5LPN0_9CAUD|nr:hypothetical protein UFOVP304_41 [uncultured Caudovirales phage]CAB4151223.1 hypothetical protein UFOVP584_6 [uncultured Caudovirales phage]
MSEFIEILSPSALKDLQTANSEVLTLIKNIDNAGKSMQNIKTPSGSDSAIKDLNAKLIQQEKAYTALQIQLERYAQAQNRTKISNNALEKSEISLEQARIRNEKALDREVAKLEASQQLYNKVQQKLNALSNEYKNLAIKKELSGKLTDAEAKRYDFLSSKITKYDTTLKAVDASMGKYQRNVGNYSSAFNPLSNSINQLTREMPAFANSVQTGFMAISNNLPIFFDAMQQAIAQQKELQAQGQPSKNALQVLAGGFFTLGTALSVGVTLLTLFGPKIIDAIFNTEKKKKADEEATKAIEAKDKAEKEYMDTMVKAGSEEISRSQILFENAKNVNMSMRDRLDAIKQLKERYPDYLGHLTNEQFLSGKTAEAEERLNEALIKRGVAIAIQSKLTEQYNKLTEVLLRLDKLRTSSSEVTKEEIELNKKLGVSYTQMMKNKETISNLGLASASREKKAIDAQIQSLFNLYNQYAPYLSAVNESTKANDKNTKALKENNKELEKKGEFLSKAYLENQISALEKELTLISKLNPNYQLFNTTLNQTKALYDALYGDGKIKKGQEDLIQGIELTDEAVYADYFAWLKLKEATDSYLKTLSSDAFNKAFDNIGLSSAKMFFDFDKNGQSTFDKLIEGADSLKEKFAITFQAVGDTAQDVFNKMVNLSNQRFETEKTNLQKEKDIAIAFAGESASAKEEINRQYDERQREIRNREAKAKKQQAIFNIIIDTAQGVVSALASGNIPLSIAIGVIGALQAGIVASQPTPQFYKGTDNAPEGWAWTQEKGAEVITDKNGKLKSTGNNKGAQMTYLNKGDKVFTAEKSKLMFDNGLNNILSSNGISGSKIEVNTPNIDVSGVIKAIENKPSVINQIDKGGFRQLLSNGHGIKEITNRRINGIGTNV